MSDVKAAKPSPIEKTLVTEVPADSVVVSPQQEIINRMRASVEQAEKIMIGRTWVSNPTMPVNPFSNEMLGIPEEFSIVWIQIPDNQAPPKVYQAQKSNYDNFLAAMAQGHKVYQSIDDSMLTNKPNDIRGRFFVPSVEFDNGRAVLNGCYLYYTSAKLLKDVRNKNIEQRQARVLKKQNARSDLRTGHVSTEAYSTHDQYRERVTLKDLFDAGENNVFPEPSPKELGQKMKQSTKLPNLDIDA